MLRRDDVEKLTQKSADIFTSNLKAIGDGNMCAAPLKIWDSATLRTHLKDGVIFAGIELIQIGISIWAFPKIKQKIAESKRIHNIINDDEDDEDNTENKTNDMEEQS